MIAISNSPASAKGLGNHPFFSTVPDPARHAAALRKADREAAARVAKTTARSAVAWSGRSWGLIDACVASLAFVAAHHLSPHDAVRLSAYPLPLAAALFAASLLFFSYVLGVYDRRNFTAVGPMVARVLAVVALGLALTSLAFGWLGYVHVARYVVAGTFGIAGSGLFASRLVAREVARRIKVRLMFVGDRREFRRLEAQIRRGYSAFYERPFYADIGSLDPGERADAVLGAFAACQPDEIVVMDGDAATADVLSHAAGILRSGCAIFGFRSYYERMLGEVPVQALDERGVMSGGFRAGSLHTGLAKRPIDVALAMFGLAVGAPLMLLCAVLVKLTSPGPVIYKQVRVGRYGRNFWIYKFRTMRTDAEHAGAVWATTRDVRVTPIGAFLRKSRLDELPQLWNILRGDMSLVGPRPERPEFVEKLREQIPFYDLRHFVPPGLTGWAQVRFRYGATVDDARRKLAFDLYYARHCGLLFDAAICLRTLVAMAKGAR